MRDPDDVAHDWASTGTHGLWRRHSDRVNLACLRRWLPAGGVHTLLKTDLFDEAVSDGLMPLLTTKARTVVGIDLSSRIVRAAQRRCGDVPGAAADVRRLPFQDGSFDCIVSNSTLDHFDSRREIVLGLRELRRTLRRGGQLLLTLDNLANPLVWLRSVLPLRWLNRLGVVPYPIGKTCGPRRLKGYVQQVGMEVLETTALMHCPRVVAVAAARCVSRLAGQRVQELFLRSLALFERLERWPTRFLTGYFIAIRAMRP
jgi:SAM-dependent methyltransferase